MYKYILLITLALGLLMYLLASNSKAQDIGRIMFFSALLGLMIALGPVAAAVLR